MVHLLDKDFKTVVLKMLRELKENMVFMSKEMNLIREMYNREPNGNYRTYQKV